jgi:hypothetical protein
MVYRIHFETKGSYWCIQFKKLLGWKTAEEAMPSDTDKKVLAPKTFDSFEDAEKYAATSGIDKAYTRHCVKSAPSYNPITSGARSYPVPEGYQLVPTQQ